MYRHTRNQKNLKLMVWIQRKVSKSKELWIIFQSLAESGGWLFFVGITYTHSCITVWPDAGMRTVAAAAFWGGKKRKGGWIKTTIAKDHETRFEPRCSITCLIVKRLTFSASARPGLQTRKCKGRARCSEAPWGWGVSEGVRSRRNDATLAVPEQLSPTNELHPPRNLQQQQQLWQFFPLKRSRGIVELFSFKFGTWCASSFCAALRSF